MAQHDYDIANQSGANFRADLNNALDAIVSNNSGSSAPSTTFAYEWWIDTSANVLKLRNSANNAWITLPLSITADNSTSGALTVNGNLTTTGTVDINGQELILDADADTSITADTDDQIDFKTAGSDRAVITSEGKFGIGNQTPSQLLNVQSATFPVAEISCFSDSNPTDGSALDLVEKQPSFASASNTFGQTGVYGYRIKLNGSDNTLRIKSGAQSTVTDRIVLERDTGNVLIGSTTSIASTIRFQVTSTDNPAFISLFRDDSSVTTNDDLGGILWYGDDNNTTTQFAYMRATATGTHADSDNPTAIRFGTTADGSETTSERLRLHPNGEVSIGTTTNFTNGSDNSGAGTLHIANNNGRVLFLKRAGSNGEVVAFYRGGVSSEVGNISVSTSTTAYNTSSDARLKNILGEAKGLEIITKLKPVNFEWKESSEISDGLIAQEVQEFVPNAVTKSDTGYYLMDYSKLVTPLIKATQEQQSQIEELKKEIETLKN